MFRLLINLLCGLPFHGLILSISNFVLKPLQSTSFIIPKFKIISIKSINDSLNRLYPLLTNTKVVRIDKVHIEIELFKSSFSSIPAKDIVRRYQWDTICRRLRNKSYQVGNSSSNDAFYAFALHSSFFGI